MIYILDIVQALYSFMGALIDLPFDYASYLLVQLIQVWRAKRSYVWSDMIVEIVAHPFLGYLGLIRLHRKFVRRWTIVMCSCSLSKASQFSRSPLYTQRHCQKPWTKKWGSTTPLSLLMTSTNITVVGNFVCMIVGTSSQYLHGYPPIVGWTCGPHLNFSHDRKTKGRDDSTCWTRAFAQIRG